jgi:hypothetical protein
MKKKKKIVQSRPDKFPVVTSIAFVRVSCVKVERLIFFWYRTLYTPFFFPREGEKN